MTDSSGAETAFCRACGEEIRAAADVCPECGVRQSTSSSTESGLETVLEGGNPFVAATLSALIPGLGQIYNRELERGIAFIIASFVAGLSVVVLIGLVLYPLVWVYSIYDAYTRAEQQES